MVSNMELKSIDDCICRLSEVQTSIENHLTNLSSGDRLVFSSSELQDMLLDFHSILTKDIV